MNSYNIVRSNNALPCVRTYPYSLFNVVTWFLVASLMSLMASLVTTSKMQQCFNVKFISGIYKVFSVHVSLLYSVRNKSYYYYYYTISGFLIFLINFCICLGPGLPSSINWCVPAIKIAHSMVSKVHCTDIHMHWQANHLWYDSLQLICILTNIWINVLGNICGIIQTYQDKVQTIQFLQIDVLHLSHLNIAKISILFQDFIIPCEQTSYHSINRRPW